MYKSIISLTTAATLCSAFSFSQTPDLLGEPPANWHTYNENKGQLLNTDGDPEPMVKYYSEGTFPRIFCWENEPARTTANPLISFSWAELAHSVGDTSIFARIDFTVTGEGAALPEPQASEQADGLLNYYFPHTQPSGVKGAKRYQRVQYENIYPGIDLELYSSEYGFKAYFIVHPGADPNAITGHFDGQDSITHDTVAGMRVYLTDKYLRMDNAFAYQYDAGGTVYPLAWQPEFHNLGNGDFSFHNIGTYDPGKPLVFQIGGGMTLGANSVNTPQWCTYYGGDGEDFANDVEVDDAGFIYKAGQTYSSELPSDNGQSTIPTVGFGDAYVIRFDENYAIDWVTVIGGGYNEGLEDIVLKTDSDDSLRVYGVGTTQGDGFPTAVPTSWQGYAEGGSNNQTNKAIIVRLNALDGTSDYRTYFGGSSTEGHAIDADSQGRIHIAGATANDSINENAQCVFDGQNPHRFTVCDPFGGAYYQNFNGYDNTPTGQQGTLGDGFIARFNANTFELEYSTLMGGFRDEVITDIFIDRSTDHLYFAGRTKSEYNGDLNNTCNVPSNGDYPLCDAGGNAFWQASINGAQTPGGTWDGFMGVLDDNLNMQWNTYIGGNGKDGASVVYVSPSGKIYVAGWTATDDTIQIPLGSTSSSEFPVLNNGSEYSQAHNGGTFDAWLWRFSSGFEPEWGSLVGGEGDELEYRAPGGFVSEVIRHEPNIEVSASNLVFVTGFTTAPNASSSNDFPVNFSTGLYNQYGNNDAFESDYDKSDGFLFGMDGSNELIYGSYFGGSGFGSSTDDANVGDAVDALAISGNRIFIVGRTFSTENFPHACPGGAYCNNNPSGVVNQTNATAYIAQINEKLWILADESDALPSDRDMAVYPNPFTERVYLQTGDYKRVDYTLTDLSGKLVSKGTVNNGEGIGFRHLQAGIYLLRIETGQPQVFKIVKQ